VPHAAVPSGKTAARMMAEPLKAYLMLGVEAELDTYDAQQALAAIQGAELVVAMSSYQHRAVDYAHVLLPIAPFSETAGTFINTEGTVQIFNGVVKPLGETRPAWKVLRVLGNLLQVEGFDYNSCEEVRSDVLGEGGIAEKLNNSVHDLRIDSVASIPEGLQRIGEVPIYAADAIVRRAPSLQKVRDSAPAVAWLNRALAERLGLRDGDQVRIAQNSGHAVVPFAIDDRLPPDCIRLAAACRETAMLGALFGAVSAERVAAQLKVAV